MIKAKISLAVIFLMGTLGAVLAYGQKNQFGGVTLFYTTAANAQACATITLVTTVATVHAPTLRAYWTTVECDFPPPSNFAYLQKIIE
jgi:hypothetical protein